MKTVAVALVLGLAGTASAMDVIQLPAGFTAPTINTGAQKPSGALTSAEIMALTGDRDFSINDTYLVGAAWANTSGGAARWVNNPAVDPSLNTFNGTLEFYAGGAATQLGWQARVVEFEGVTGGGNKFVQTSVFRNGGGSISASGAGFPILAMSIGEGIFVGDPVNLINVNEPDDINVLSVTLGFFNGASFVGSVAGTDLSTLSEIGAFGAANLGATAVTEMFLFVEYEVVPAPSALALIGVGGLAAGRRRR